MVPCYNEASRIRAEDFLTFARGSGGRARLLFVDDGSVDDTLAILEDIRSKCPEGVSEKCDTISAERRQEEGGCVGMIAGCLDGSTLRRLFGTPTSEPPLDHVAMFRDAH